MGRFLQPSVKIGEPVKYTLVYKHAPELEVVFPDSGYRFAPFEFIRKETFPTRTIGSVSTDSTVFLLRTFNITPQQQLNLPVFLLQKNDTIRLFGQPSTIKLQEVVKQVPEPLALQENLALQPIEERFNYPYLVAGLSVLLVVFGSLWFIFRKKILTRYRLYVMQKKHTQFISRYNMFIDRFHKSADLVNMEKAITLWKNHLTELEDTAINSFTTKEIVNYYDNDEDVTTALKLFDRAIYGNILSDKISDTLTAFYLLHHFADRRYEIIKAKTLHAATAR
ncbi:hypothetical protein F0P94_02800 [Adhaeribacter soli]|uniref:Uncharacterized protein n=1 Tax=Adhaeribacter soli TaxID=2607655 RepID=A0A5N1J9P0_9BACT|nr:hypothetical protein F0P94_02800 [Adhaeribacter soli]